MNMKSSSAIPTVSFDWLSRDFKENPFPTLARLREAGPLIRTRLPILGKAWLATTFESVNELLRDHHRFVQSPITAGNRWMAGIMSWLPRSLRPLTTNMLVRDPPDHRRLRSLVDQAFQRHSIESLRPRIEQLADDALDAFAAEAARSPGGVDLLAHFARPFPLSVICELLGLPPEDRPQFTRWAAGFSASSLFGILWGFRGIGKLLQYVAAEIQRQRQKPREGLLAALIQAEETGERLSDDELVAMIFLLLAAGHETTLHQIAGSVLTLLDHPKQLDELRGNVDLPDAATQELLRYISFAQVTKPRYAHADTEFYGQKIRRGEMLFGCLASANSDPSVFEHPDQLNFHREVNRHVAFGVGIHVCLGAKLARVEIAVALQRLFRRFPSIRLAVPRSQIQYLRRPGTRALISLPVQW
jgi:cytochrome P450